MQKLLTAALLLAGCTLQPASAQKATLPPSKVASAPSSPTPALHWAAAEFCEAYGHYYQDLPSLYRYNAGQALQHTPLATPDADFAKLLTQQPDLREAVYKTIYQYCHTLKYGMGDQHEMEELVYAMLCRDLHMSGLAAAHLAPHISTDYQQSAPTVLAKHTPPPATRRPTPTRGYSRSIRTSDAEPDVPQTDATPTDAGHLNQPALYGMPGSSRKKAPDYVSGGLEMSGWRFDAQPVAEAVDDNPGVVRFKIIISDDGEVESVTKLSGNVSAAQEQICRERLLNAEFIKTNANAGGATGFYTFRFSVR